MTRWGLAAIAVVGVVGTGRRAEAETPPEPAAAASAAPGASEASPRSVVCEAFPTADCKIPPPPPAPFVDPLRVRSGPQVGVRLAYAAPLGTLGASSSIQGTHLSDLQTAWIPIGVDVGYRLSPGVYVGGTALLGPGTDPSSTVVGCQAPGVSCSRVEGEIRGEIRYYFVPDSQTSAWVSAAAGWELGSFSRSLSGAVVTSTFTGPVIPDLELGFDARSKSISVGPYVGLTLAYYVTEQVSPPPEPSPTFTDFALHTWVTLGLRGAYGPW